jgi:hypothetical protein
MKKHRAQQTYLQQMLLNARLRRQKTKIKNFGLRILNSRAFRYLVKWPLAIIFCAVVWDQFTKSKYFPDQGGAAYRRKELLKKPFDDWSRYEVIFNPWGAFIQKVRIYMGSVIHEVLADEKVNQEGLNFLERAFKHS